MYAGWKLRPVVVCSTADIEKAIGPEQMPTFMDLFIPMMVQYIATELQGAVYDPNARTIMFIAKDQDAADNFCIDWRAVKGWALPGAPQ